MAGHATRRIAPSAAGATETLDPEDWSQVAELTHRMVDDAVEHIRSIRDRPVWRPMPQAVEDAFRSCCARSAHAGLAGILRLRTVSAGRRRCVVPVGALAT